ncbi:MAG: hypothetical protein E6Q95_01145 [Chitinophagaceae bacterium]|nr:MAG: hypothetical protein E6Q95_01145 [Chitinophagaceae bacterium]
MKILYSFLMILLFLFLACSKKKSLNCDALWKQKMYTKWNTPSNCSEDFKKVLYKGRYQNQTIYYEYVSCKTCKIPMPEFVFNCNNDSIQVDHWDEVQDIQLLASCTDFVYPF